MLGDLHALLCAGVVAALCLQHCGLCFYEPCPDDRKEHNSQTQQDVSCRDGSGKKCTHHYSDSRDLQRLKDRLQDPQKDGCLEFLSVFFSTEGKEFSNDFNHCLSPPCVLSTSSHRARGVTAALRGCRCRRSIRLLQHRSGLHRRWWRGGAL